MNASSSYNEMAGRLMVALDYPDADRAKDLVQQLEGIPCYMKVGMQLFYAAGPDFVKELKAKGYSVFLDVKMHDIPNTVKGGSHSVTRLGVDMFNVHAGGGALMMQAAKAGAEAAVAETPGLAMPTIIAVTQLTSTNQDVMNNEIGIPGLVEDTVVRYASLAQQAGLHGVVASSLEVEAIRTACGKDFKTVIPGIRPAGADIGDQARVLTPGEAVRRGSHYLVVGRPITATANPRQAAEQIIEEMIQA
ncbi:MULTISPECIES: orotidine-5'-phosphate decarboxylase [unclassified Paenibacillus]|uniref:orotidine-5'-phosphate decarboxylase n=1 Tax=Paenibacillus TaxID=44249 RepID=UPI000EAA9AF6|nr:MULTISPECIES: orotidine-5'-phosphate decarboxylase [unclassified Paenibacillus]AWP28815.1 orotidine 5'-phosphate decarboxylase [Paenibacillus sp. Cedars]MDH6672847.1 orotidine-5'-phosphate decarboxylase [Paenibacillus sp. LBL]RKM08315.1 orotidine-5'-phosphate decarboxylase [Moraxella catarrhalis]